MIYIFRIGHLGDSIVALPALFKLKQQYANEDFVLISNRQKNGSNISAWDVLKHSNLFKSVIYYETNTVFSFFKLIFQLRFRRDKTKLIYLCPSRTCKQVERDFLFFRYLCNFKSIVGLSATEQNMLPHGQRQEREYIRLINLVSSSGSIDAQELPLPPLLAPEENDYRIIEELLKKLTTRTTLIAMGHGSKMPAKKWPKKKFRVLCEVIFKNHFPAHILLLGGKEDYFDGEFIKNNQSYITNLSGKTSLMESAACLQKCTAYIGNDTGTMHLAAIMGIPVIGIFSARDQPGKWEPYGERNRVIRKEISCSGCMLEVCNANKAKCLRSIKVRDVYNNLCLHDEYS